MPKLQINGVIIAELDEEKALELLDYASLLGYGRLRVSRPLQTFYGEIRRSLPGTTLAEVFLEFPDQSGRFD